MRPAEECRVFICDHHVGYIDWATYEENRRIMRRNSVNWEGDEAMAAIRAGQGILVGLLRRHCGRKLHVRYWGGRGTNARYLCKGDYDGGGQYCIGFGGGSVDRRVGQELLKVMAPLGVKSECGAVAVGRTYLLPPLSSGGASLVRPWLRFHTPLIEPDMRIARIRALGQDLTASPTTGRAHAGSDVRARECP